MVITRNRTVMFHHLIFSAEHQHIFIYPKLTACLFCDPLPQDIILYGWQDARQSVRFHRTKPTERDAGVSRVPLCQEESGECGDFFINVLSPNEFKANKAWRREKTAVQITLFVLLLWFRASSVLSRLKTSLLRFDAEVFICEHCFCHII